MPPTYAVGRLHFDDVEGYKQYVNSLIAYERGETTMRDKTAVFFRTQHDEATRLSALQLVQPLVEGTPAQSDGAPAEEPVTQRAGFRPYCIWDEDATKEALATVFERKFQVMPPAFLFSATHGAVPTEPNPEAFAGALRCQDSQLFTAQSLLDRARCDVHGLFVFLNACYSAGVTKYDQYPMRMDRPPASLSIKSFIAALPKALLSYHAGSALACIGHVGEAFSHAFYTNGCNHLIPYRNAILTVLGGDPVGLALRDMRDRYSALDNKLTQLLYHIQAFGLYVNDQKIVHTWSERNEVGGYVLIGDPAVRLNAKLLASNIS